MMPQEEFRPGLRLYFPKRNWEITLYKKKLTVGGSPFADITLGEFSEETEVCVEFYLEDGRWMARRLGGSVVKNMTKLEETPVACAKRDWFMLGSEDMIIREMYLEQGLDQNFTLFFESIHLKNGHVGSQVSYDAAKRQVKYEKWGIIGGEDKGQPPEIMDIPPHVTTRQSLYGAVAMLKPCWPVHRPELCEEDHLIYFDGERQIRFDGRSHMVVYTTRWENGWKTEDSYRCFGRTDRDSIRMELKRNRPDWPSSNHELLEEFEVVSTRWRRSILYHDGFLTRFDYLTSADTTPGPAEIIGVPITVTDRAGVIALAKERWPEMFPDFSVTDFV